MAGFVHPGFDIGTRQYSLDGMVIFTAFGVKEADGSGFAGEMADIIQMEAVELVNNRQFWGGLEWLGINDSSHDLDYITSKMECNQDEVILTFE